MSSKKSILVAYKLSRYEEVRRSGGEEKLQELMSRENISTKNLEESHNTQTESLETILKHLEARNLDYDAKYRGDIDEIEGYDLIITVGGDGTVLDISHRVYDTPILAINSDPNSSVGYFCAGHAENFPQLLDETLNDDLGALELFRYQIEINDKLIPVPVLNEILITHQNPAATSRYVLNIHGHREEQKSSGIWLSTPAGSTAAIRSAGGYVLPLTSKNIQYLVREPYPPPRGQYKLFRGIRPNDGHFEVYSKMDDGRIYIDGPYISFAFGYGDKLSINKNTPDLKIYGLNEDSLRSITAAF